MTKVDDVIAAAQQQLGDPYIFGDEGPDSFDCSGLMQYAFGLVGLRLPRTAREQQKFATKISAAQRLPGDLIFWGQPAHHVALYVGDGKMISAPGRGQRVHLVRVPSDVTHYGRVSGLGTATAGAAGAVGEFVGSVSDWAGQARGWMLAGGAVVLGLALVAMGGWQAVGAGQLRRAKTELEGLL